MQAEVNLENSFKRMLSKNNEESQNTTIKGTARLSNGKDLDLEMVLENSQVIIKGKDGKCEANILSEEERVALIEAILKKYVRLGNAIKHLTIIRDFESFKLADATNTKYETIVSKKTIVQEFVESDYSSQTLDPVLNALKTIYDYMVKNYNNQKDVIITLKDRLNQIQISDLKHLFANIVDSLLGITDGNLYILQNKAVLINIE